MIAAVLASVLVVAVPAKVAISREPSSPVGDAVTDALLAGPDETVRFEVRERPVEGSRVQHAKKLCAVAITAFDPAADVKNAGPALVMDILRTLLPLVPASDRPVPKMS